MVIHYSAFRAHDAPVLGTHDVAIPNGGVRTLTCAVSGPTGLRSKTFIIYGNNNFSVDVPRAGKSIELSPSRLSESRHLPSLCP